MDQSDDDFSVGGGQDDGDDEVSGVGGAKGVQGQGSRYETVDCRFERIGDTNGVIYYLGARHAVGSSLLHFRCAWSSMCSLGVYHAVHHTRDKRILV